MRAGQEAIYRAEVRKWLALPENQWCRVWLKSEAFRVELAAAGQHRVKPMPATQCHHIRGRRGPLLLARQWWCPVSSEGHQWIDRNPDAARKLGLLCEIGKYNTVPFDVRAILSQHEGGTRDSRIETAAQSRPSLH